MPGGTTRTTTYFDPYPLYIARGEGCRIWDVDGTERLDLLGNYTAMILGHAHPKVVEAVRKQAAQGTGFAAANPVEATRRGLALWLRQVSGDPATFQLADPGSHSAYDQLRERMRAVIAEAIHAAAPGVDPQAELLVAAAVQGAAEAVATAWAKSSSGVSEAEALDVLTSFCWGGLSLLMDRFAPAAPPAVSSG